MRSSASGQSAWWCTLSGTQTAQVTHERWPRLCWLCPRRQTSIHSHDSAQVQQRAASIAEEHKDGSAAQQVVVVCRKGNDSQMAASMLIKAGVENVRDLQGGLHAWARVCDDAMPLL